MKLILLVLFIIVAFAGQSQTIRIADNNPNAPTGPNIFTGESALQNAINAAVTNDIVYIQPSVTNYGNVTIGKRIVLKGAGFNIPELGPRTSAAGQVTIINSSDGVNNISNATLTGFQCTSIIFGGGIGGSEYNNITIENVVANTIQHNACLPLADNLVIRNCYANTIFLGVCSGMTNTKIYNNIIDQVGQVDVRNTSSPLISNNLFFRASNKSVAAAGSTDVRIEHNVFSGDGNVFQDLLNALIVNNIFYGTTPGPSNGSTFRDNTFSNNLVLASFTMPPPGNGGGINSGMGNIVGVAPQFTNANTSPTWTGAVSNDYTLLGTSPCLNAATTGDNIGPSGGMYPFTTIVSLKPSHMPFVTLFSTTGVVPQSQPLKANIKAKGN